MTKTLLILCLFGLPYLMAGQSLSGTVTDKRTGEPLLSANITLTDQENGKRHTATDLAGHFLFKAIGAGTYTLTVSYVGYQTCERSITLSAAETTELKIALSEEVQALGSVTINATATRATQRSDSLIYNAESFKVLQGSDAVDLLGKMPGIIVEGGSIQAQGEDVKKILVDGKEFFDGDVNLALKNLPADIIASIEVFDKKSEQAEFTGFDDGEEIKTINIVTKAGYQNGTFGELYAGYGTDNRYKAGGNLNLFNDDRRISILGLSNNINQQNFSQEDLAGVMSAAKGGGRKGRKGGGRKSSMASAGDFMVGNLGGITSSNGLGINYADQWGDKAQFTGSYFLNQSNNRLESDLERQYFESVLPGMSYKEREESEMRNWNHRINMRLDYQIDPNNSLLIKPSISFQDNNSIGQTITENLTDLQTENRLETNSSSQANAYNIGTNITYRHRFPVVGRTLSVQFNGNMTNKDNRTINDYLSQSRETAYEEEAYGQLRTTDNRQASLRGNLAYTEKLTDLLQLQVNYKLSYSNSSSDRKVYDRAGITDLFEQLNDELSYASQSNYLTQSGAAGLRLHKAGFNLVATAEVQYASLTGKVLFPHEEQPGHDYLSFLPALTIRYTIDRNNSFQLRYRSGSSAPSISDLQAVIDNSNPLFLTTGNPDLDQQVNHSLNLRYIRTTSLGHTLIGMLGATIRSNYIGDSILIATEEMTLPSGVTLEKGAQLTKPVNLRGYYSLQAMLTYGFPINPLKSNLNFSLSGNYANVPTQYGQQTSETRELNLIPKVILGSNISHQLDFTLSYSATINKLFSSIEGSGRSDYTYHLTATKIGWTPGKGWVLRGNLNYSRYAGLESDVSDYILCGASVGKRFLKDNQAEIRLEASDILNQNQAFTHLTGSNYYDYIQSNVLRPYLMLSFIYTIR